MNSKELTISPQLSTSDSASFRCGYVALVGRPNVGKSTLFNAFIGQRLSIVTPKPQTTRSRILGILTRPHQQFIFLDTPGVLEPRYRLHQTMVRQIELAARQADLALLLLDASQPEEGADLVREFLRQIEIPVVAALNKIDLLSPAQLEEALHLGCTTFGLEDLLPISALRGEGIASLLDLLASCLPCGPMLYPEEIIAEQPMRFFAAEFVREAAFVQLEEELPYAITVAVEEFEEQEARTYIRAVIYVERESQKGIVIGRGGGKLRAIGIQARRQLEEFLGRPVYLDLWVKVRPDWRRQEKDLREFGYL